MHLVAWPSQLPFSWQYLELGPNMLYPELHEKLVTDPIAYLPLFVSPLLRTTVPFGRLIAGQLSRKYNSEVLFELLI